jgi:curved DNA-binding protein CbpA
MNKTLSPTGEITDMTVPWLFQGLHAEKKTGTLVFTRDDVVKKVYLSAGDIIFAASNLREDWLGEWLARAGTITKEQGEASAELVRKTGKKQGAVLVELGFLTPKGLVEGVKFQVRQIIISIFNWRSGSYAFDESPLPAADIIPLTMSTGNLIIQGLHELEWEIVRKALPPLKATIGPAADPFLLFQGADLEEDTWTVFSLMDGNRSIEEICCLSGMGDFNTLKAIYVLLALRMAETGTIKTGKEQEFVCEVVRRTAEAAAKKPEKPRAARMLTKEELRGAYDSLKQQDHYEVLGVGRGASSQDVKKAYFSLAKLYHPDRHFSPEMGDMKEKLETLFVAIHEAYDTLADQAKRDRYDLELSSGMKKGGAAEGARSKQPDNKDAASARFKEGMKQFAANDFWDAAESFQWATRLDPNNAEYVFRLGLALSRMPRRGREAEEYLMKATEMAPSSIEYYLELGDFYEKHGLKAKALDVYQEALKRDPNSHEIKEAILKAGA